jgi:hypothetical protein
VKPALRLTRLSPAAPGIETQLGFHPVFDQRHPQRVAPVRRRGVAQRSLDAGCSRYRHRHGCGNRFIRRNRIVLAFQPPPCAIAEVRFTL